MHSQLNKQHKISPIYSTLNLGIILDFSLSFIVHLQISASPVSFNFKIFQIWPLFNTFSKFISVIYSLPNYSFYPVHSMHLSPWSYASFLPQHHQSFFKIKFLFFPNKAIPFTHSSSDILTLLLNSENARFILSQSLCIYCVLLWFFSPKYVDISGFAF